MKPYCPLDNAVFCLVFLFIPPQKNNYINIDGGELVANNKLTAEDKEKIYVLYAAGESLGAIAKKMNCAKSTVHGIVKRSQTKKNELSEKREENAKQMIDKAQVVADDILDLIVRKITQLKAASGELNKVRINDLTSAFVAIYDRVELMRSRLGVDSEKSSGGIIEITQINELNPPKEVEGENE
jgi:predicted DNA-binding protein YlxM (UPF0122 family)